MDRLGLVVIFVCMVVVEAGVAYVWTNNVVESTRNEMEHKLMVNMTGLNVTSKTGMLMGIIPETNASAIKLLGPVTYIWLFNQSDALIKGEKPNFDNIWKIMVSNATEHEHHLLQELTIGQNYTIWYIDYVDFARNRTQVLPRTDVLVGVEKI